MSVSDKMLETLKTLAKRKLQEDGEPDPMDEGPMGWSGGNFDDCYALGVTAGRVQLARDLLADMGISAE